jgi:hypothetical protein
MTDARHSVSLFVKNLLGDRTVIQRPSIDYITLGLRPAPRTIGITGNVVFLIQMSRKGLRAGQ